MKTGLFTLVSTEHLTPKVALLHFSGNTDAISVPGQFVTVSLPGFFLHRPFSVLDWGRGWLELMVEQVGPGTAQLQHLAAGSTLMQVKHLCSSEEGPVLPLCLDSQSACLIPVLHSAQFSGFVLLKMYAVLNVLNPAQAV